ncbi:MAG TPA: amidase family protein, partial [Gaiellales bacterium]|nr:amidase family protein [Gaiellales bacterium]
DDEVFPSTWSTYMTATGQHLIRVIERLHGQPIDPARLEPANRAWLAAAAPVPVIDYLEAAEHLWAYARRILRDWHTDEVLLTPTLTRLPAAVGGISSQAGVTDDATRFSALVRMWNVTGQPAISLPITHTATGTPVGVQLVAAHGHDDLLLALAGQLEAAADWRTRAPDSTETRPGR